MRIWLDDERPMPEEGFDYHAKTAWDAIEKLQTGGVEFISLDHDLGPPEAGTGYDVAAWLEEQAFNCALSRVDWEVHSANPVGRKKMEAALEQANKWWSL